MTIVNMLEAKTHLSRLVVRAARGEEIVIARAGHPMAKLTGIPVDKTPRRPGGALEGKIHIGPDFDELPEDIAAAFRGECD
jgi:antitoxin (DNA-binding transcriptional repressor) of toxin-antitoxin stability system